MLLPQGTILPNFYFFSIFLQKPFSYKNLKISSSCFIYSKGVGGTPLTPFCYFLLSSTPTIDTEPALSGGNMENEKSTLTVLMVEPGKTPYQATIGADLKSLQQVVGGYIESIAPFDDPVAIICNEEGKLEQLPFNRGMRDESGNLYDYIAGNFMIVGLGEEDFTSLPPEYIEKYSQLFAQPEILNIANGRFEVLPDTSFEQQKSEEPNMSM